MLDLNIVESIFSLYALFNIFFTQKNFFFNEKNFINCRIRVAAPKPRAQERGGSRKTIEITAPAVDKVWFKTNYCAINFCRLDLFFVFFRIESEELIIYFGSIATGRQLMYYLKGNIMFPQNLILLMLLSRKFIFFLLFISCLI